MWGLPWGDLPGLVLSLPVGPGKSIDFSDTPGLGHEDAPQENELGDDVCWRERPGPQARSVAPSLGILKQVS